MPTIPNNDQYNRYRPSAQSCDASESAAMPTTVAEQQRMNAAARQTAMQRTAEQQRINAAARQTAMQRTAAEQRMNASARQSAMPESPAAAATRQRMAAARATTQPMPPMMPAPSQRSAQARYAQAPNQGAAPSAHPYLAPQQGDIAGCNLPLAMAWFQDQKYGDVYQPEQGMSRGTLFPDLDKPWLA